MSNNGWFDTADYKSYALFRKLPRRVQHVLIEPICGIVWVATAVDAAWQSLKEADGYTLAELRAAAHERIDETEERDPAEQRVRGGSVVYEQAQDDPQSYYSPVNSETAMPGLTAEERAAEKAAWDELSDIGV